MGLSGITAANWGAAKLYWWKAQGNLDLTEIDK